MSDPPALQREHVTVREFASAPDLGLDLEILAGHDGLENSIRSPRIQKLGLALAGFTAYIDSDRLQILGASEVNFLANLSEDARRLAFERLQGCRIGCVVITTGLAPPEGLLALSLRERVPVLRTPALSSVAISKITHYLESRLAPKTTIHGVLVDIFGLGVLLLGSSGIGKSECALDLVLRGHRLVADDLVEITRHGIDELVGAGGPVFRHHMEVRGLGIINIRELFGISATGAQQKLDLAISLERWNSEADYDRLGLEHSTVEFLGVSIPLTMMPVAPGRSVSTLVEVAARIHLLRQRGYQPSRELLEQLGPPEG